MRGGARLVLATALSFAAPAVASGGPVVTIDSGRLEGSIDPVARTVHVFRGVPYAAPPVAALRWREPQPVARWRRTRRAAAFGPRCMQQPLYADMRFRSPPPSEDCLYLNVWAPAMRPGRRLPVLLYLHGGGFQAGDGSERRYDGAALARAGIVAVTVNYRLGVFGFLAHPALTAASPHGASGNYGLLDQVAALGWVRRNVAAFGGDPRRITIGGESAGAMSVSALMASPLSRGRFAGAIGESGALMGRLTPPPRALAERTGAAFAHGQGAATIDALRMVPADRLLAAQGRLDRNAFGPVVDGYMLTEPPATTVAQGRAAAVPLLVGSNSQEAAATAVLGTDAPTVATYRRALVARFGDRGEALFALYLAAMDADVPAAATALASDAFIALPTWTWFDLQRRTGAPTYFYSFAQVRPPMVTDAPDAPRDAGAVHSAEIEYALDNLDANPLYRWTEDDRRVATVMSRYWANFIKAGNPNGVGLPAWPTASTDPDAIRRQVIDTDTRSVAFPEQHRYIAAASLLATP